jgi:hypothetical protein
VLTHTSNFIQIQQAQGIGAQGYQPTPLRTGYERIIPQRAGELFSHVAKESGVIKKRTKDVLVVEYASGQIEHIELGRQFGQSASLTIPHELISSLNTGDTVNAGDSLAYNPAFFEPDPLNPRQTLWKAGVMCKVALMESTDTFEDSSAISERTAEKLKTKLTKIRNLFLTFNQNISRFISLGDTVEPTTVLCTIDDDLTVKNELFDESSLDTLKLLSSNTPRAQYGGVVEHIEVLYYGDKEDMSESIRALVDASDQRLLARRKQLGQPPLTGALNDSLLIDNQLVELDSLIVRVYITEDVGASSGDKGVFANQMKSIFTRVMVGTNTTEDGTELDAIFGYNSINARLVLSPEIMGTTNTLLRVLSTKIATDYFNDLNNEHEE